MYIIIYIRLNFLEIMFFRRLKLSHTRCFLPAIYFNKNIHDEIGTKDVKEKNVGGWQGVVNAFSPE